MNQKNKIDENVLQLTESFDFLDRKIENLQLNRLSSFDIVSIRNEFEKCRFSSD